MIFWKYHGNLLYNSFTVSFSAVLIADLDQDGSQELISYLTTYTNNNPEGSSVASDASKWHLQSRVRVVRLEAELPKLYEAVARQWAIGNYKYLYKNLLVRDLWGCPKGMVKLMYSKCASLEVR